MTDEATSARTGRANWLPLVGAIVFVAAMTVSTAVKFGSLQRSGMDMWFVVSTLLWALAVVALIIYAVLMASEVRIRRRTRSLRQAFPAAYIAEVANDPELAKELHHLVRRLDGIRVRFPSRGTQTLVVDSTGILLCDGSTNYRKRVAVPIAMIERVEESSTRVGQYQLRAVPSVNVICRTTVDPIILSFHLLRFAGGWPLFLSKSRNASECVRMLTALGHVSAAGPGLSIGDQRSTG
ncbi:hypothetical protein ACFQ9V_10445 [Leifsonia sp. NPDC056665]|uniref:hypothetical protein n=1 Tax=Leifsonia sp. NPDC056665 TaxID=3345901 RepID=UPI0036BBB557